MWVFVVGCAHAAPPPAVTAESSGPIDAPGGGAEVRRTALALEQCRTTHASDPTWAGRDALDTLEARLRAHLASLRPPRVVAPEEVQPLAEALWGLLDQGSLGPGHDATVDRAEAAAERLLRDRGEDACVAAAQDALAAAQEIGTVADAAHGVDPCEAEALAARRATLELSLTSPSTSGGNEP